MVENQELSEYRKKIDSIINGRNVKYYNAHKEYLVFGGKNYELTPSAETELGSKRAYFVLVNIDGKELMFLNPLYYEFANGSISSDKIKELQLADAFDLSDNSGLITDIQGAEIGEGYDLNNRKIKVVINKGKIELNGKKFEQPVQQTAPIVEEKIVVPERRDNFETLKFPKKNDESDLLARIEKLESIVNTQGEIIVGLKEFANQQQSYISKLQKEVSYLSNYVKESNSLGRIDVIQSNQQTSPVEKKSDYSLDDILNEYSDRSK